MASLADQDFCSLAEEKFDFEVSLSPASIKGDNEVEDEVFLGPVTHKEKCISHGMAVQIKESVSSGPSLSEEPSWSPLLEENFDEICKEAHLLASHLERTITNPSIKEVPLAASKLPENTEKFEVDSSVKLDMFSKPADALSPIKRETFCVQDSPMKQLPPAIQKRLQKVCGASSGKPRLSTSSPVRTIDTQPKVAAKGRSLMASSGLSKSTSMVNSRLSSCTRSALPSKTRLPPPSKSCYGLKRSPARKNTSITGSAEDLLSDTASVASDVSDSSFNTSLPVKRGFPVPNKTEIKGAPVCKVPTLPNRRVVNRSRNTSSSSSSVSSINSSQSVSPAAKGKLNSSLNTSVGSISNRVPSSGTRLPSSSRKSGILSKPMETSVNKRTSFSLHGRKGSEPLVRPVKPTPVKRAESGLSVQHQTPVRRSMERTTSVPNIPSLTAKTESNVKANSVSKAFVAPTPTNSLKGVNRFEVTSPDVPRIMKPKRLMTSCSVDGVQRLALPTPYGLQTPSAATEKPVQAKLRRPSALPTPVNRRVSGIPMLTPKSVPRLNKASCTPEPLPAVSSSPIHTSPCQIKQSEQHQVIEQVVSKEEPSAQAEFWPCSLVFNLEDDADRPTACEPAAVENSAKSSSEDLEPHHPIPECLPVLKSKDSVHNGQLNKAELQEVLLFDVPAPVLKQEEKVLIDLSNTPDLIKTVPVKAFAD
ncbi:G2 and S phase-expressed protein 1 isoform X2 [Trichomycterus rosablanca]|uniref:G2 and S phase-expressed protein 1 isoform X2 n=1 Tax=Trichomycterus rosablanca TaxID=2290929 RepID=UPI002F358EA9